MTGPLLLPCRNCGSKNVWDVYTHIVCDDCGATAASGYEWNDRAGVPT